MERKTRLSASVDPALVERAREAVSAGRVSSVSAWVEEALRAYAEHERGLEHLQQFVDEVEAERGPLDAELRAAARERLRARTTRPNAAPGERHASSGHS